jgi:hypothetical protein
MQDATSSPWLSNGAERGEDDAWSDRESSYLSPHDDDAASSSHSLASSSPPEPMDALDGLSFGTFSPELKTRLYLPRTNPVLMQDLSAEVTVTCAPHYLITPLTHVVDQAIPIYVSESIKELLGWDPQALHHKSLFDLVHPDEVAAARALHYKLIKDNAAATLTYLRLKHASELHPMQIIIRRTHGSQAVTGHFVRTVEA